MRRGWIFLLLVAGAGAQGFSAADLDRAIRGVKDGRRESVDQIAKWGPRATRAAPALLAALQEGYEPGLADSMEAALWAIGPAAIPQVAKAAKRKDAAQRVQRLLERFAREAPAAALEADGVDDLLRLFADSDRTVRIAAANGVATAGNAAVPKLMPLLGDKNARRREAAAFALGRVDPPPEGASRALMALVKDENDAVRAEAVLAIGRVAPASPEALALLLAATVDPSERVAASGFSALEARGKQIVPQLIEAWDKDDATAKGATEVLVRLGDGFLEQAVEVMRTGSARRKRFAAAYLGGIGAALDLSAIEGALMPALSDPSPEVRLAAAESFGIVRTEMAARALDALLSAAADPDPRVRANVLAAAARGAPAEPRVLSAAMKAKTDQAPEVKLVATLLTEENVPPATWTQALGDQAIPVAARVLAAERLRSLTSGFAEAVPAITAVVADATRPAAVRAAAASTLRTLLARRIFESRGKERDAAVRDAVDRAYKWLAAAQREDGHWAADAWNNYDLGVTALAVLAYLAGGHGPLDPAGKDPYAQNVRAGIGFIASTQTKEGLLISGPRKQHTLVEHAIATQALCEAVAMMDDRPRRAAVQAAVDCCIAARNPALAWRYEVRGGENDTHVTSWMVSTLRVAEETGFKVDTDAYKGALDWIEKMSEPNFGQIGYNYPGGAPFRAKDHNEEFPPEKSHAMTAAGIWMRTVLGEDPRTSEMIKKGADLCVEIRPSFEPGCPDFYYWYFGTMACFEVGGMHHGKWERELRTVVLARQKPDGSWDPEDAWGFAGGRVYSTAILALALLTPTRYPRVWSGTDRNKIYGAAQAALDSAADSPWPRLRAAAAGD